MGAGVDHAEFVALAEKHLGGLPATGPTPAVAKELKVDSSTHYFLSEENLAQL